MRLFKEVQGRPADELDQLRLRFPQMLTIAAIAFLIAKILLFVGSQCLVFECRSIITKDKTFPIRSQLLDSIFQSPPLDFAQLSYDFLEIAVHSFASIV